MTVPSSVNRSGPYSGNGVATVFDYDFKIVSSSHLTVVRTIDGVDSIINPSDYAVTGVGADSGTIVFSLAPAVGQTITIIRNVPFTQETDLENQGAYYAETVEAAFDLSVMRDQQLEERLDRAVQIPVGADPTELPGLIENILRLSNSVENIDTVADNIDAVNEIAPYAQTITENLEDITNFADVYQGPKASDPTTRNDGSALQSGDLYFNTTVSQLRVFNGTSWVDAGALAINTVPNSFTGNGVQTAFTLSVTPGAASNVLVWVGGVRQNPATDYVVNNTTLTFAVAPINGAAIETLVLFATSTINVPADGSVTFGKLAPEVPTEIFQEYFPGVSKNVQGTGLTGTDGDEFFQYAEITAENQVTNQAIHRVQKHVNYTGGTPGNVKTASWTLLQVEDGPLDFHWAGLDQLINYASAGENVARYSKAEKRGTGGTWAACFDIEDQTAPGTSGVSLGLEVTVKGNGADTAKSRNGINIAAHKWQKGAGSQDLEWGRGFWTSANPAEPNNRYVLAFTNTAKIGDAVFHNSGADALGTNGSALLRDTGTLGRGVDLASATYGTNEAIRLGNLQKIAFVADGSRYMRSSASVVEVAGARLQPTNGLSFPSSGLVSSTATAAGVTKPATYSGFISVLIDGTEKKIPFYNA